jgi:cytochrome c5
VRLGCLILLACVAGAPAHARAGEDALLLKAGAGRALVEARCVTCHSLDYIPLNSPILDRAGWEASLRKMVKVMGAPLNDDEMRVVLDYLEANYGR